jgi:hypothetical protein
MRQLTLAAATAVAVASLIVLAAPAVYGEVDHRCNGPTCTVGVGSPALSASLGAGAGSPPSASAGASSGPCPPGQVVSYSIQSAGGEPVTAQPGDLNPITGAPVAPGSELEDISCDGNYLTAVVVPPRGPGGPGVTGVQLARQAFSSFQVMTPVPRFSPAQSVVGVATWLWLGQGWSSRSATASVPGLSATVMAEPSKVVWDMGDGGQTVCAGPGNAWDPHQPNATTDCSYTYPVTGHFTATVTVYYATTWSASNGTAGQLAGITGRASVPVTVNEIQAVNNN